MPSTPEAVAERWPESSVDRDRFLLARRPERPSHDPWQPGGFHVEEERTERGAIAPIATVFLTGRECPWRCAMCDLWQHTTEADTPAGAIPRQIEVALTAISRTGTLPRRIKLYNAGSFFDPRAVPEGDYEQVAARLAGFDHVVVESHPALVGERVDLLLEALARSAPQARLEVAMGLETAHPGALAKLHKGMSLAQFEKAALQLRKRGLTLRVFLLVPPPFVPEAEQDAWLGRSIDFAFARGASVVSLVPTRAGNGTLEVLARQGLFRAPRLADLERALSAALPEPRGRVFADLWDLERFSDCAACLPSRRAQLHCMNLEQADQRSAKCAACGDGPTQ